jgi:hypothetical protein
MLPDDVLLEIFDIYVNKNGRQYYKKEIEVWLTLVHVCRRWRSVVFGSPHRLNLRLFCTSATPARDTLDLWPSLPLLIRDIDPTIDDEILAVLERSDRVVQIELDGPNLETVLAAMQVPFPELTYLRLHSFEGMKSILHDSFLGGSAPRLESLSLSRIPFPRLPKLLLSATHLVTLHLWNIPHSGYISPEAIVTVLSTLTSLESLTLQFKSPLSRPDWANRRLPPPTRSVLPVLIYFRFKGACEYLEDLVTCIDTPRLNELSITLFNQIVFDTPQSIQFISRAPTLETFEKAHVVFQHDAVRVNLSSQTETSGYGRLSMRIQCIELDWQVSSMEQVCTSCLPTLSALEDLYIYEDRYWPPVWKDNIENTLLLELLRPFTGVKNLYLSEKFASCIISSLQELTGGRATEVLPALQNIFLEELQESGVQAGIERFAAMRQVTSQPIAVSRWDNSKQDMEIWY